MTNSTDTYNATLGNLFNLTTAAHADTVEAFVGCSEVVLDAFHATSREDSCRIAADATRRLAALEQVAVAAEAAFDFQLAEALRSYSTAAFQLLRQGVTHARARI